VNKRAYLLIIVGLLTLTALVMTAIPNDPSWNEIVEMKLQPVSESESLLVPVTQ